MAPRSQRGRWEWKRACSAPAGSDFLASTATGSRRATRRATIFPMWCGGRTWPAEGSGFRGGVAFGPSLISDLSVDGMRMRRRAGVILQPCVAKEQVLAIDTNSPVEVRFMDGARLRGWIGEVSDTGFVLSHEVRHQLTKSQVAYNQIRAVKQVQSVKPSHTVRSVLIGVGITLAAIGIIFGVGVAVHGLG